MWIRTLLCLVSPYGCGVAVTTVSPGGSDAAWKTPVWLSINPVTSPDDVWQKTAQGQALVLEIQGQCL